MEIKVLGPIDATSDGVSVAVSANQRLLLAVLVARNGDVVPADVLIDTVWGDLAPRSPKAALQNLVSRIRARLGPDDLDAIATRAPGYRLGTDHISIDRLDFIDHVSRARQSDDAREAIAGYDRALALWGGTPYAEFDASALHEDIVWLTEMHRAACEERLARCVQVDPVAAVPELEALVAAEPHRERGHALLMEALYRSRRQRDALAVFDHHRVTLAQDHGLEPSSELKALEHAILTDTLLDDGPAPDAREPGRTMTNLGARRTSFVGRDAELSTLADRLCHERLITVVGVGGAGKTSLAVEVARAALNRFPDGVWLVDLLQVSSGERIPELAAAAIGLPSLDPQAPVTSLADRLRMCEALIVLDNCEHVIDGAAAVADAVLDASHGVHLLATSREPLRVTGEAVHRIRPLTLPEPSDDLDAVVSSASGLLLTHRIQAADDLFEPDRDDRDLLRTICWRLDGLPLALELAAARVPSLGLRQVADRLDDRFGLLTNQNRSAADHHQTLRAAIAWSVDLLDDRQRLLLARLSVFAGSFDLPAVEAVCADDTLDAHELPAELAALVERSLVEATRPDRTVRYRLLETVREFATIELGGLVDEARARHRQWFTDLAHRIGDGFLVRTSDWYARLRADLPNLRAAFTWSLERDDAAEALDIASALRWAPLNTGHLYREHRDWVEQSLAAARTADVDPVLLGRGLVAAGSLAGLENRSLEAVDLLEEAVTLLLRAGSANEVMWARMWLGAFRADLGDFAAAVEETSDGLAIARRTGSRTGAVYLANQHGENAMAASRLLGDGRYDRIARNTYRRAIDDATQGRIEEGLLRARHGMAFLEAVDDPSRAMAACDEALVGWRSLGGGNRLLMGLVCTARVAILATDLDRCAALLNEAADTLERVGWKQSLGRLAETAAVYATLRGRVEQAAALSAAADRRFLSPRWFVPIDAAARFDAVRDSELDAWAAGVQVGEALDDDGLLELIRSVAGTAVPTPLSR